MLHVFLICSTYLVFHNPTHSMASTHVPNSSGSCGQDALEILGPQNMELLQNRTYLRFIMPYPCLHILTYIYIWCIYIYCRQYCISIFLYIHIFSDTLQLPGSRYWNSVPSISGNCLVPEWCTLILMVGTYSRSKGVSQNPMAFDGGWYLRCCIWWYRLLWQAWQPPCFEIFVKIFVDFCLA